jgi:hypothetical protein
LSKKGLSIYHNSISVRIVSASLSDPGMVSKSSIS